MKKLLPYACFSLFALSLANVQADEFSVNQEQTSSLNTLPQTKADAFFQPFTAKVRGKKVRMRLSPDLESHVVQEVSKDDLFIVVGEKNGFYAIEPPENTKAYVFRSFVLDGVIEGSRVNVRLEPELEAPVVCHLNSGDKVEGNPSPSNNKWLEINAPSSVQFFIAKEYLEKVGNTDYKKHMQKRKQSVEQLLESTNMLSKAEMQKSFDQIDVERLSHAYKTIIRDYSDFPDYVERASNAVSALHDTYTQRKIAYLESKANIATSQENSSLEEFIAVADAVPNDGKITDKMKIWEPLEEALFLSSNFVNQNKDMQEFYSAQKSSATILCGIVEAYNDPVKRKPGNYILRQNDLPVAYLYSTKVNLERFIGKKISVIGAPRDNNNFAFPAYFVLEVE